MSTQATLTELYKTSTTPGTAVALGASTVTFNELTLRGYKAADTLNTGNVKWRAVGYSGWHTVEPGTEYIVPIPAGCFIRASQIEIDVATSGDGVHASGASAVVYTGA